MAAVQTIGGSSERVSARKPRRVSTLISDADERDLRLYFARASAGPAQQATLWGMMWNAWLFSGARPCLECGGDVENNIGGTGFVPSKRPTKAQQSRYHTRLADWLKVLGLESLDELEQAYDVPKALSDQVCRACNGFGWVHKPRGANRHGEITARPTGSSVRGSSGKVEEPAVVLLGRTVRRLALVYREDPRHVHVLDLYYGGAHGLFGVYVLTSAGRTLMKREGERYGVPGVWTLLQAKERNEELPEPNVTALLRAAEFEARDLYYAAAEAWNRTVAATTTAPSSSAPGVREAALRLIDGDE